jgi:hypothetical protein
MTAGRWLVVTIVAVTALFAAAQWWFQTRAYYVPAEAANVAVALADGGTEDLPVTGFTGIDADTSPLRYRGCFRVDVDLEDLAARAVTYDDPTPLIAPGWFDCFDATAIGAALEAGQARAFLSQTEIRPGADRVVAIYPDGRGFAWHQWNGSLDP